MNYVLTCILLLFTLYGNAQTSLSSIDNEMVFLKAAVFQMGSTNGKANEQPVHPVKLNAYYISKYEVTQALWKEVMGSRNQAKHYCAECPVYDVNMNDIDTFLTKLNLQTGKKFRLPTEAEWEYAACGANVSKGYKYCGSNNLGEIAWYEANSNMETHPVGQKKPNELGLYDMSGNVWEICSDWFDNSYYKKSPADNPNNTVKSTYHVVRGGSWRSGEQRCQSHARNKDVRDHHISNGGLRLVMEP